jgi:hypothetical protein
MHALDTLVCPESFPHLINAICSHDRAMQVRAGLGNFYAMAQFSAFRAGFEAEGGQGVGGFLAVAAHLGIFGAPPRIFVRRPIEHV